MSVRGGTVESEERGPRQSPRVPVRLQVEYRCLDDFLLDYASNMSMGGMFIETSDTPLPVGTRFSLGFRIPGHEDRVETDAVVKWVNDEPGLTRGMGVRFEGLNPSDEAAVQLWLRARKG